VRGSFCSSQVFYWTSQAVGPVVDFPFHQIFAVAVSLLQLAFELLAPTIDRGNVIISEIAPLLFDLADRRLTPARGAELRELVAG
jgi:hypothetical protein